jgi:hypothetical protein
MKSVLAVLAGVAAWTVLWMAGTQGLMAVVPTLQPEMPIEPLGALLFLIGYSVVLSVLAGWVTGRVAPRAPVGPAGALAAVQLSLGIFFQASAWALFPLWYHVIFLGLVVPATVSGAVLVARGRERRVAAAV